MGLTLDPVTHSQVALWPLVQRILDNVSLCAMASVNVDGTAHANTAFFCIDSEWCMYFVSSEDAKHSRNIAERPSLAVTVYDSRQDWDDWKTGLQLFGTCFVVDGPRARLASALYKKRFPAYARWLHTLGRTTGLGTETSFFKFEPDSLKLLSEENLGEETFVAVRLSPRMTRLPPAPDHWPLNSPGIACDACQRSFKFPHTVVENVPTPG